MKKALVFCGVILALVCSNKTFGQISDYHKYDYEVKNQKQSLEELEEQNLQKWVNSVDSNTMFLVNRMENCTKASLLAKANEHNTYGIVSLTSGIVSAITIYAIYGQKRDGSAYALTTLSTCAAIACIEFAVGYCYSERAKKLNTIQLGDASISTNVSLLPKYETNGYALGLSANISF